MSTPRIRKVLKLQGKTLVFRNVEVSDAAFILSLRTNEQKSMHLSKVKDDLKAQEDWIRRYLTQDNEVYFIIEDLNASPLGTVRLYDAVGDSFCWGSWIMVDGAPTTAAIESALIVYKYALDCLGFTRAHFQVNKGNQRVCAFHERFGAVRQSENNIQYHYIISTLAIRSSIERYRRYLPDEIYIKEYIN